MAQITRRIRALHRPDATEAVVFGLGLAYLTVLGAFALAFAHPPRLGWLGFAIVGGIVLALATVLAQFLMDDSR